MGSLGMRIGSVKDVVRANLCTGCGICEALSGRDKIEMKINASGFYRPYMYEGASENWETIRRVCPGLIVEQVDPTHVREIEKLWGPIISARAGYSTDAATRWQASSGGALSALLTYLLETNEVDYVVHVGVTPEDPFRAVVCKSYTRDEVLSNAGSRYSPTAPLVSLAELLSEQSRFAFVGKPCDIAALRAYGRLDSRIKRQIVALFSFFCAGIPSLLATDALIGALGVNKNEVKTLRYRGYGWPGRATATDVDGQEHSTDYESSWGGILGPCLQFRCKICPDGTGEMADIVAGDAWHVKDGRPSFEERPGRSLILARTSIGRTLIEQAELGGYLSTTEFSVQTLDTIQPFQKKRRQAIAPRLLALQLAGKPFPKYHGFHLASNALHAGPWTFFKEFGGMLRRLTQGRAND
jgi:coenzyme F420 hydrogenase subunit beta